MSKITLSGNASGTGTFTIASPNSNSDRTVNLPDAGGDMVLTTATQTLTNKTLTSPALTTPTINSAQFATVTGTAPIYPCRAWVNFNGTGTVAIRASGNVSSITDNGGSGDYTVNFTTAMPDANSGALVSAEFTGSGFTPTSSNIISISTTSVRVFITQGPSGLDRSIVNVAVFR
jgi:hypothetical protein